MNTYSNECNESEIANFIIDMLKKDFNISIENNYRQKKINLFDEQIGLSSIDMVYLFKLIENEYNIAFNEYDISNEKIYTVMGMSCIINKKLLKS